MVLRGAVRHGISVRTCLAAPQQGSSNPAVVAMVVVMVVVIVALRSTNDRTPTFDAGTTNHTPESVP